MEMTGNDEERYHRQTTAERGRRRQGEEGGGEIVRRLQRGARGGRSRRRGFLLGEGGLIEVLIDVAVHEVVDVLLEEDQEVKRPFRQAFHRIKRFYK